MSFYGRHFQYAFETASSDARYILDDLCYTWQLSQYVVLSIRAVRNRAGLTYVTEQYVA